jgi:TetR/AcrR family transcriptional regulator, cholesterol catabolism regulator
MPPYIYVFKFYVGWGFTPHRNMVTKEQKRMKQNDARERLINAAIDLFYKKGYPATTIRDIGEKADISTSVIYHYFNDKEEMLFEIIELAGKDLLELLGNILKEESDPVESLKKLIKAHMVDWCLKRKKESKIIVMDDAWLTDKRKKANIEAQRKLYFLYKTKLKELQEKGLIIDTDLTVLCFSIFGIIAQSIRWFSEQGPLSKEEVADNVIQILFNGVLKLKDK